MIGEKTMHEIEPFQGWNKYYEASRDPKSPFYGSTYDPFTCSNTVYNYYIHPGWEDIGSPTLYAKLIYTSYQAHFAVLELIGEWNDTLHNDIMYLSRNVIEPLLDHKIRYFALIGENILNFHASDDAYYQEWSESIEDGWIACINFRLHIKQEFERANLDYYLAMGGHLSEIHWRVMNPAQLFTLINELIERRLPAP